MSKRYVIRGLCSYSLDHRFILTSSDVVMVINFVIVIDYNLYVIVIAMVIRHFEQDFSR